MGDDKGDNHAGRVQWLRNQISQIAEEVRYLSDVLSHHIAELDRIMRKEERKQDELR